MIDTKDIVTLPTLGEGAAVELFDKELARVVKNVLDPNYEAKKTRKVTLELALSPNDDRTRCDAAITVRSTLPPKKSSETILYVGIEQGQPVAVERNPKQLTFDDALPGPRAVKGNGGDDE